MLLVSDTNMASPRHRGCHRRNPSIERTFHSPRFHISIINRIGKESSQQLVTDIQRPDIPCAGGSWFSNWTCQSDLSSHPTTGKFQIGIVVNNAGTVPSALFTKSKSKDIQNMYTVNVQGPLLLTQAAQPYLLTDRSGRIVNISSISSTFGSIGQRIYAGTKAALDAMARNWSRELADNATVNSVNPGPVATEMVRFLGFSYSYLRMV
jgi:NAD(P)-dependent dehydrogenase (short-subunit alcohol dehydrogenase family)